MCIGHFPSLPSLQPDQLNFKKGWLSKLFDGGVWKKRWFVLTDRSLRWYRDTVAEEVNSSTTLRARGPLDRSLRHTTCPRLFQTGDLDGEVDLSTCCDVTEFPVLRNYGFQIHTKDGTVTLSAVTSGIRRHWIQAMLKNVKTITAPDVTRTFLEEARAVALPCPTMSGLNAHSSKAELQTQMDNQNGTEQRRRRSRIRDRRLEGRYRTFDWAEFRRELLPQKLPRPPEKARDTVDRKALPTPATTMPKEEGANRGGCGLEKDPPREEGLSSPPRLQQETNLPCQQEEIKPPEDERQVTNSAKTPMSVTPDLCSPLQNALEKQRKALDSDVLQDSPSSPWIPVSPGPQHRTEEQGQPRLSEASSEWALAQVKSELQLEQERSRECRQRWECAEQGLRVQLQERGECLQAVEAHLLQRGQALFDLEQQQALQHDHLNEAEQLQDRLAEVTGHLVTTEEAQAICEQRLQENLEVLQEKQERERHGLAQCLATAQGNMWQLEQRLLEVEQQAVALLSDKRPTRLEAGEAQLLLKDDAIEKLTESVRLLEAEKSQLHRRCRELAQQAVIADSKWKQLREMGSCAEKAECVQQVAWALQQKDKEIENIKEMYEKMLQRKDQDLNEAVVKMAALGSSLEETEFRLQAKEQLLRQLSCGGEASKLQVKLMSAMEQIVQLEQCQEGLRLAHADLQKVHTQLQQDYNALILHLKSFSIAETLTMWRDASCVEEMPEDHGSVHCGAPMGPGNFVSQDSCKASAGNDPAGFISVIRCLEAKLLATEEKLRDITVKLQDQQDSGTGWPSWGCGSGIETCAELGKLNNEHHQDTGKWTSSTRAVDPLCRRTQTWMGPNKKEVSAGLSHDGPVSDMEHPLLVKVGRELSSIAHNIGLGAGFWEDNWTDCEARDRNVLQENRAKRIAEMLAFEALVLSRMASSIRSQNADLFLNLSEIYQEVEKPNSNDDGDGEVDVHALALKLRVESEFWIEVEKLKMCQDGAESTEGSFIENPCVKANLDYAVQNLKLLYKVKFQRLQEDAVNMRKSSPSRDWTLRGKGEAAKSPAVDLIPEDIQKEPACYLENPRMNRPGDLPSYSTTMESLRLSQDTLASELEAQAVFLQRLSREVGMSLEWKSSGLHLWLEAVYRTNSCYSKVSDTWDHTHCLQEAMVQAQVAYVVCRLRAEHKNSLQLCRDAASLQAENKHLRKELLQLQQHLSQLEQTETRQQAEALQVEQRRAPTELALVEEAAENKRKLELVLIEMEKMEDRHEEHIQKLEETFQRRLRELGSSHEEESPHCRAPPKHASIQLTDLVALRKRIRELEAQVKVMKKELGNKQLEKSIFCLKEEYQQDLEHLKVSFLSPSVDHGCVMCLAWTLSAASAAPLTLALCLCVYVRAPACQVTCQLGFAAMEDAHQKAMEELHKRHQTETAKLQEERDRLLAEETAATIAGNVPLLSQACALLIIAAMRDLTANVCPAPTAIEAMKKAHHEELKKVQRAQLSRKSDADELGCHYE
ncbi:centrosome-associated protein CEP250-like [Scleropages formosus]|uniref:Centrosome-associated protein CEP250-like n=1 Tax=Scleropages formosus TaxID=113540 RepID=A0A0P7WL30_SCLFO|nr:centrosome-associated protein CEP250-like [Scleropages formosus]